MDQNAPQPSFELPSPVGESQEVANMANLEHVQSSPEQNTMPPIAGPPVPVAPVLNNSQQPQTSPVAPVNTSAIPNSISPAVADDQDLIEKEWVIKAKQIVAATKEDPHAQSRELSKFKADYLKKRYNKDIKVDES